MTALCRRLVGFLLLALLPAAWSNAAEAKISFTRQIKPILAGKCFACHGPDEAQRKGELRLDVRDEAVPSVIKPGDGDHSEVVVRITAADADERMPPADAKKPAVTAHEAELIRRWIDQGAEYDVHWAYVPPTPPAVPAVRDVQWPANPIDHFIQAKLAASGLSPAAEADRRTLLRRLSLDVTGLPPTPAEVDAFVADQSADAYERLVERLLVSPRFGERLAIYWLDIVRYADTGGYHSDNHRDIWAYRDYVISAFNGNKPFDLFTMEQLAGDLLPSATSEQRIASGYNRLLQTTEEGGAQPKEYAAKYAADRVRNTAAIWLAATMGCCECHHHKFDPFTQQDFYRLAAFFADVKEKAVGRQEQDNVPLPEKGSVSTLVTTSMSPRTMRVLPRGNWLDDSGEMVVPGLPSFGQAADASVIRNAHHGIPRTGNALPDHPDGRLSRLDLARWLADPNHPLTARVLVNRLWKVAFGRGIVKTLDDFGSQGELPTHPELLDWLATDFVASGWDIKHTLRLMLLSRTYRQTSSPSAAALATDPANDLFSRQNRFRLEAELIRDQALAVSGLLAGKIGGPSVKPYQPAGYWQYLNFPTREWQNDRGEDQYRRGLYTYWQRTFLHPSLAAFDASTREECTVERPRNNTPQQALVLLNDPTYVESARVLAARVLQEGGISFRQRLEYAFEQVLSRPPVPAEEAALAALLDKHQRQFASDQAAAAELLAVGDAPLPAPLDSAELAAWTSVARTLLNLHEAITRF